ncbi:MAG: ABC transporter ATP-binding protein [Pseudomonadota bacterium]|nr:ABC transporter ATP-binding protein [Pseudomonadota bacterium]
MALLEVDSLRYRVNDTPILDDISFALANRQVGCLLGQSGCGKTTLLRCIAGLEKINAGHIKLNDQCLSSCTFHRPAEERRIGMVFQDFALFPHLDVAANIAYGILGRSKREQRSCVGELLGILALQGYQNRYPHELSGGEQQRVAIARAIAPRPRMLLLDEPFANIDIKLRETLKSTLMEVLVHYNITAIFVTHNQEEAFDLADYIGILADGNIIQWGRAQDLYHNPKSVKVVNFIGVCSALPLTINNDLRLRCELGCISDTRHDINADNIHSYQLYLRPDDIIYDPQAKNFATVVNIAFRGTHCLYQLRLNSSVTLNYFSADKKLNIGDRLPICLRPERKPLIFNTMD